MVNETAIRYLQSKGWQLVEEEWATLKGVYEEPVCLDTAHELQKMLEESPPRVCTKKQKKRSFKNPSALASSSETENSS